MGKLTLITGDHGSLDDLEPAWPAIAHVRELVLESSSVELGEVELPSLRSFELVSRGLTRENLHSLQAARWPQLERLTLSITGAGVDGCDVELSDLKWILDGETLSHVVHLGLVGGDAGALAQLLLGSAILSRLKSLDLSRCHLAGESIEFFRAHPQAFSHLTEMTLPFPGFSRAEERAADVGRWSQLGLNISFDERYIPVSE